ncbi:hypothetical protein [Hafnia paralvei]|uniref:hypothetical protein n=1 Tax=Hafnia paralvei TaxID=546367 RepID=UPI0029D97D57|nr:hypothetical protein [Hafnia paralvei]MDX6841603.1 hypothetical protein [Hafnia paralvei]
MNNKKSNGQIVTPEEAMRKCFVSMSKSCLEIRPRETYYGALSSRLFLPMALIANTACLYGVYITYQDTDATIPSLITIFSCILAFLLEWILISRITMLSNIVFNRKTQECFAYFNNKKYISDVNDVVISGGAKTMISMYRHDKKGMTTTQNIEIDDEWNVQQISNYIQEFIRSGHKNLPIPAECEWNDFANVSISLSPYQALRHYAPWPFSGKISDPIEKMLKIYMWPIYTFILFPISMFLSLLWYPFTKIFNIKPHSVPGEAYEGDDSIRVTPEMAAKGIRP